MHSVRCRYSSPILLVCLHLTGLLFLLPGNGHTQSFSTSTLTNLTISNPTSLQFGPDQKLYVSEQGGKIKVLTIERVGANDYTVINEEVILLVQNIMNHRSTKTNNRPFCHWNSCISYSLCHLKWLSDWRRRKWIWCRFGYQFRRDFKTDMEWLKLGKGRSCAGTSPIRRKSCH